MILPGLNCLRRALPLLLVTAILGACGQTGALYLPEEPQEQVSPHEAGGEAGAMESDLENTESDSTKGAETETQAAPTNPHQH